MHRSSGTLERVYVKGHVTQRGEPGAVYVPSGHGALEQVADAAADFKPDGHGV
jgi:hypothetical protein